MSLMSQHDGANLIKHLKNLPPSFDLLNVTMISIKAESDTEKPHYRMLVSCPRSGSTLLMRILAEAPDCVVASRLMDLSDESSNTNSSKPSYFFLASQEIMAAYEASRANNVSSPQPSTTFTTIPTPLNYTHLKPIFLVRDPIRTWNSWKHRYTNNVAMSSFFTSFETLITKIDSHPRTSNSSPPSVLVYENLVRSPEAQIQRICSYWGMSFDDHMLSFRKGFACYIENENGVRGLGMQRVDYHQRPGVFDTVLKYDGVKAGIPSHDVLSELEKEELERRLGPAYRAMCRVGWS